MTRFVLDDRYSLRGWEGLPFALWDNRAKAPDFLPKEAFLVLLSCDGVEEIDVQSLPEERQSHLRRLAERGVVRECSAPMPLMPSQRYRRYPCRFKAEAHWSITGRCN